MTSKWSSDVDEVFTSWYRSSPFAKLFPEGQGLAGSPTKARSPEFKTPSTQPKKLSILQSMRGSRDGQLTPTTKNEWERTPEEPATSTNRTPGQGIPSSSGQNVVDRSLGEETPKNKNHVERIQRQGDSCSVNKLYSESTPKLISAFHKPRVQHTVISEDDVMEEQEDDVMEEQEDDVMEDAGEQEISPIHPISCEYLDENDEDADDLEFTNVHHHGDAIRIQKRGYSNAASSSTVPSAATTYGDTETRSEGRRGNTDVIHIHTAKPSRSRASSTRYSNAESHHAVQYNTATSNIPQHIKTKAKATPNESRDASFEEESTDQGFSNDEESVAASHTEKDPQQVHGLNYPSPFNKRSMKCNVELAPLTVIEPTGRGVDGMRTEAHGVINRGIGQQEGFVSETYCSSTEDTMDTAGEQQDEDDVIIHEEDELSADTEQQDDSQTVAEDESQEDETPAPRTTRASTKKTYPESETTLVNWIVRPLGDPAAGRICVDGWRSDDADGLGWHSSAIVKRIDRRTVETASGSRYRLMGNLHKEGALEQKVPLKIISAFQNGFPESWKQLVDKYFIHAAELEKLNKVDQKKAQSQKPVTSKKSKKKPASASFSTPHNDTSELDITTLPCTRSGRIVKPQLAHWAGQRVEVDRSTGMVQILMESPNYLFSEIPNYFEDKRLQRKVDNRRCGSKPASKNRSRDRIQTNITQSVKREVHKAKQNQKSKTKSQDASTQQNNKNSKQAELSHKKNSEKTKQLKKNSKTVSDTQLHKKNSEKVKELNETSKTSDTRSHKKNSDQVKQSNENSKMLADTRSQKKNSDKVKQLNENSKTVSVTRSCVSGDQRQAQSREDQQRSERLSRKRKGTQNVEGLEQPSASRRTRRAKLDTLSLDSESSTGKRESLRTRRKLAKLRDADTDKEEEDKRDLLRTENVESKSVSQNRTSERQLRANQRKSYVENHPVKKVPPDDQLHLNDRVSTSQPKPKSQRGRKRRSEEGKANCNTKTGARKSTKRKSSVSNSDGTEDNIEEVPCDHGLSREERLLRRRRSREGVNSTEDQESDKREESQRGRKRKDGTCSSQQVTAEEKRATETFPEDGTRPWSSQEEKMLYRAVGKVPADCPNFWDEVASQLPGRTSEECSELYYSNLPDNKKPKKKRPSAEENIEPNSKDVQITGGRGTYKRRQQLQKLIQQHEQGYEDDYFSSTPMRKQPKVKIPDMNFDVDFTSSPVTPWDKQHKTPRHAFIINPASEKKTPANRYDYTPGNMSTVKRKNIDKYVHKCLQREMQRKKLPLVSSNKTTDSGDRPNSTKVSPQGTLMPKLMELTESQSLSPDSEEEQDYYGFSDEEVQS